MRNVACALLVAGAACLSAPKPAEAWGGGFALGTVAGLGAGAIVGSVIARPYPYAYYPYGYYPYPYAYPGSLRICVSASSLCAACRRLSGSGPTYDSTFVRIGDLYPGTGRILGEQLPPVRGASFTTL